MKDKITHPHGKGWPSLQDAQKSRQESIEFMKEHGPRLYAKYGSQNIFEYLGIENK